MHEHPILNAHHTPLLVPAPLGAVPRRAKELAMSDASKPAGGPAGRADDPAPDRPGTRPPNFIAQIVEEDLRTGKWGPLPVHTRFPPEPNGYLHIGHAKSICLNFGLAKKYGGKFNLRFDDTNPVKEEQEYVDSIKEDVRWLGGEWDPLKSPHGGGLYFASDYFGRMYEFAEELIRKRKAYVCELSAEEVSARRGTPTAPATSPFRDRPVEESLRLIREMRDGKHPNGAMTVRAKIDLASPNFNLRDPVMYRILHEAHHNTGTAWCIYPMYDWAHGFEDSIEGITHSICTLEFENHRPLYDWFIDAVNEGRGGPALRAGPEPPGTECWATKAPIHHPQQIEFAKGLLTYTVLSKRNLLRMVEEKIVNGWDDPRMPTISGLRRRGYSAEAIRGFWEDVGVTKTDSTIDLGRLENAARNDLNRRANRVMAVLRPLKVVIENWPAGKVDWLEAQNNPEDPAAGSRKVPFSGTLFVERDDFMEDPPKKFFRLAPGREVRLRWAYFIRCERVVKDAAGNIVELRCTYDPATRGGDAPDGRKVKATLHWVSAEHAIEAEARLFDRLLRVEEPGKATGNFKDDLNPNSLEVVRALLEPSVRNARVGDVFQFERLGYFCVDRDSFGRPALRDSLGGPALRAGNAGFESRATGLVFNRTVTLKDAWTKAAGGES
jgi:glutaminyl-tRNA synthetase